MERSLLRANEPGSSAEQYLDDGCGSPRLVYLTKIGIYELMWTLGKNIGYVKQAFVK
jgi:hypothetical protein